MSSEHNVVPSSQFLVRIKAPKKAWRWLMLAIVVLFGVGATWVIVNRSSAAEPKSGKYGKYDGKSRSMPVLVAKALSQDVKVYLDALGTVSSRNAVTVKTRINGQLTKLYFREGQSVKAGTLLAEVDPRPYQVALAQVNALLAKDKAVLYNAQMDLDRYKTLVAQDSLAKQQLDTQEALVQQDAAVIAVDQAQVDNAKLQLSYCRTLAPLGGVVGLRQVDPGNQIQTTDVNGIVTITQLQPITVLFPIPEDNLPSVIARIKDGDRVPVEAYDRQRSAKLSDGRLLTLDNQINTATGTIMLRAEFKNEDGTLFPNQFVNTRLLVDVIKGAVVVPASAVQRSSHGSNVYVLKEDETVELRAIKTGVVDGENIVIAHGLAAGESVIIDGADKLRDGAKVRVVIPGVPDKPHHRGKPGDGRHHHRSES